MANHVIRDGIWRSKRLGKLPWKLASLYPWIFLVCDDFGRFEYRPHSIWSSVFAPRKDFTDDLPSQEDVALALSEYARVGLLVRYHMDGDLAAWRKFRGKPPSQQNPSSYPDPVQFVGDIMYDDVAWAAWISGLGATYPAPTPQPSLSLGKSYPDRIGVDRSGLDGMGSGPSTDPTVNRERLLSDGNRLLGEIAAVTGEDPQTVLARASSKGGKYRPALSLDSLRDGKLFYTVNDLRVDLERVRPKGSPGGGLASEMARQLAERNARKAANG